METKYSGKYKFLLSPKLEKQIEDICDKLSDYEKYNLIMYLLNHIENKSEWIDRKIAMNVFSYTKGEVDEMLDDLGKMFHRSYN